MPSPLQPKGSIVLPSQPVGLGRQPKVLLPGSELDYVRIAGQTTTTSTTAVALLTGNTIFCDGSKLRFEFFADTSTASAGNGIYWLWYVDGAAITAGAGEWAAEALTSVGVPIHSVVYYTPTPGMHQFVLRWLNGGAQTGRVGNTGSWGCHMRITKA